MSKPEWVAEEYGDGSDNWSLSGPDFNTVEGEGYVPRGVALLMAAAPDLLEALQHERWCRACADDGCATCNDCTTDAAIAKAEGK